MKPGPGAYTPEKVKRSTVCVLKIPTLIDACLFNNPYWQIETRQPSRNTIFGHIALNYSTDISIIPLLTWTDLFLVKCTNITDSLFTNLSFSPDQHEIERPPVQLWRPPLRLRIRGKAVAGGGDQAAAVLTKTRLTKIYLSTNSSNSKNQKYFNVYQWFILQSLDHQCCKKSSQKGSFCSFL